MKLSPIRNQIRNAILVLAGCLILILIVYLSRTLIRMREGEALESLSVISQRDTKTALAHFQAVERASNSLTSILTSIRTESYPASGTIEQILKLTPEIKRIWIYRQIDKGPWLPWINFEQTGSKLEKTPLPDTKWSTDQAQTESILNYFQSRIETSNHLTFKVLYSIDSADLFSHAQSLGNASLITMDEKSQTLIGNPPPDEILKALKDTKQSNDSLRIKSGGREYMAYLSKINADLWLARWVDLSLLKVSIFETLLELFAILLLFSAALLMSASFFSKRLSEPFRELMRGTEEIGKGNFDLKLIGTGNEESSRLASAMNRMGVEIQQLIVVERQKSLLESELRAASLIQENMIPGEHTDTAHYAIQSIYKPALECSGDWWQYHAHGERLLLIIADVTGHGVASALTTSALQACYQGFIARNPELSGDPSIILTSLISELNTGVYAVGLGQQNATCFACLLDHTDSSFYYANCAHPSGLLIEKDGKTSSQLRSNGQMIGVTPVIDASEIKPVKVDVSQAQTLFIYTDGIFDLDFAPTPGGRKKVIREKMIEWSNMESASALAQADQLLVKLIGSEPPLDDVSLLMVAFK